MTKETLLYKLTGTETPRNLTKREQQIVDTCLQLITNAEQLHKPIVSGSLLLLDLMQVANIKNEDGMPVISYLDKPNGGSVAYVRHDAMVKKLNNLLEQ